MEALKIYERIGETLKIGEVNSLLAHMCFSQKNYTQGIEYGEKAIEIIEGIAKEKPLGKRISALIDAYRNTGMNYSEAGQEQKALTLYTENHLLK